MRHLDKLQISLLLLQYAGASPFDPANYGVGNATIFGVTFHDALGSVEGSGEASDLQGLLPDILSGGSDWAGCPFFSLVVEI